MARKQVTPAMEANRSAISARDCEAAVKYLDARRELLDKDKESNRSYYYDHCEGLLIAAIIAYARAFTDSFGESFAARRLKVNLGEVFGNDGNKIKLHKLVIDRRNKAVAHADWKYHKSELIEARETESLRRNSVVSYNVDAQAFREIAARMQQHFQREAFERDTASVRSRTP